MPSMASNFFHVSLQKLVPRSVLHVQPTHSLWLYKLKQHSEVDANRTEVYTAVRSQVAVFWVLTPCSDLVGHERFGGPCCLHLQVVSLLFSLRCQFLLVSFPFPHSYIFCPFFFLTLVFTSSFTFLINLLQMFLFYYLFPFLLHLFQHFTLSYSACPFHCSQAM